MVAPLPHPNGPVSIRDTLESSGLFAGLEESLLSQLAGMSLHKVVSKGTFLFLKGTPVGGVYIVEEGAIALRVCNFKGKECILHVCHPFESFAEEALVSEEGYPADAYALMESRVLMVPREGLLYLLRRHPELGLCLLRTTDRHMRKLMDWLDSLVQDDVPTRLAEWLLQRCANPRSARPCSVTLPVTKRLLASELGTIPETFSRTLTRMQSEGLLRVGRNSIILNNPQKLASYRDRQNGPAHPA